MRGDSGFPVRIRFAKRGKVRFISHRDVARAFERAFRIEELPARVHRGVLAPPEGQLRARALGRPRERRRVPRRRAHASPSTPNRSPSGSPRRCPRGWPSPARCVSIERAPALQEAITEVQFRVATVDGRGQAVPARRARRRGGGRVGQRRARASPAPARARRAWTISVPRSVPSRSGTTATRRCSSSRCRRNPVVPGRVRCSTPSTGSQEPVAASASPSTACSELHNGSNAAARGWNRWPPTRSRPPSRRAHHERRNRCPTRRSRRRPHPRARPAAPAPLRPHHLIPQPLGPNRPPNRRAWPPNRPPNRRA